MPRRDTMFLTGISTHKILIIMASPTMKVDLTCPNQKVLMSRYQDSYQFQDISKLSFEVRDTFRVYKISGKLKNKEYKFEVKISVTSNS